MDSHPQNPEIRNNPENFHPCIRSVSSRSFQSVSQGVFSFKKRQNIASLDELSVFPYLGAWTMAGTTERDQRHCPKQLAY